MCKAFYLILGASNYEYLFLKNGVRLAIDSNINIKLKEFGDVLYLEERGKSETMGAYIEVLRKDIKMNSNENSSNKNKYRAVTLNKIEDIMIYFGAISERKI